jgi:tRNA 2-thiouridine synthesizing protein A
MIMTSTEENLDVACVDAIGLRCPEPMMLLHAEMRQVGPGSHVRLLATDPSTERDVAKFCQFLGHELVESERVEGQYRFLIRKSS